MLFAQNGSSVGLELDIEHYVVPAPSNSANSAFVYAANMAENPRSISASSGSSLYPTRDGGVTTERPTTFKV